MMVDPVTEKRNFFAIFEKQYSHLKFHALKRDIIIFIVKLL